MARRTSSSKGASGMRSEPCRHRKEVADQLWSVSWGARQQLEVRLRLWGSGRYVNEWGQLRAYHPACRAVEQYSCSSSSSKLRQQQHPP